jgi:formamidopyrimidine-DNA glycosylase
MPELPEVEMVVRGLRPDVIHRTFTGADIHWPKEIVKHTPATFAARVAGQRVETLERRGKYIVFGLSADHMLVHLKMTGRLYVAKPGEMVGSDDRWVRVSLPMDDGRELRFSDARKFGRVFLAAQTEEVTGALGPEPLDEAFTLETFQGLIARRGGLVKPLLLNQAFVAGVGNIYADEALWRAQIDPRRKASTLKPEEIAALYQAIQAALQDGIQYEGASINWYRKPDGSEGDSQNHFNVYGREDEPCKRCGTPIQKIWLAQRGTHFCPRCQK